MRLIVRADEDGRKLDRILRGRGVSRRLIIRLKRTPNGITRNDKTIRTIDLVSEGDEIVLSELSDENVTDGAGLEVPVLYEDEHCIVFDKPPFMPCHRSPNHYGDTLADVFNVRFSDRPFRCINRLDKNTSGCVLAAKSQLAAFSLQKTCKKVYVGIFPEIKSAGGRICAPIGREDGSAIKRCVREDGSYAATTYYILDMKDGLSLAAFIPETGRTHQIRVHCSYIGHPLIGDDMYGGDMELMQRHALHCARIEFVRPFSDEAVIVESRLPHDMADIIGKTEVVNLL